MNSIKVHLPPTIRMICALAVVFWNCGEGEIPVPEFYGAYFLSNGELIEAKDAFEENRLKTVGDRFSNKTGIKRLSGIPLAANDYIVIYEKGASSLVSLLQLGKFKFVKELELGIWPNRQLYKMNYWILEKNIPMNIGPVKGQPDLYRMVPKTPLSDGVYAVYYNIESVISSDKRLVLDFAVGKVTSTYAESGEAINSERDALLQDVNNIAAAAASYWRKPAALGGGARSFSRVADVITFGVNSSNANGKFVMSNITANQFTLTATGANKGVVIVATITQQGISGKPMIADGVSVFTSEKSSDITESLNLVKNSWTHVEYVLQRRYDIIPNLLEILKGYLDMTGEERILISTVSEARRAVRKAGMQTELIKMYNILERDLARLLIIAENYPNLEADPSFIRLQEVLKNTRDRLETAKRRYNHSVHTYNEMVASTPSDILSRNPQFKPAITFDSP